MDVKPDWLRIKVGKPGSSSRVRKVLDQEGLNTVCEEAGCPNRFECWSEGTATFMLLGDVCTRSCSFCGVTSGSPEEPEPREAHRIAVAVSELELDYVVLTSVARDDLADGGAAHWSNVVARVENRNPGVGIEVLIPDFQGNEAALATIIAASPQVLNHNLETVPRLYPEIRPEASYKGSLALLERAAKSDVKTKSGFMLGLGEKKSEVDSLLRDLRSAGVELLTIGQYLQPSSENIPVRRWVKPSEFERWEERARSLGFTGIESAPLVRSSYHAARQ